MEPQREMLQTMNTPIFPSKKDAKPFPPTRLEPPVRGPYRHDGQGAESAVVVLYLVGSGLVVSIAVALYMVLG